jgi:hypothetical protein
MHRFSDLSVAGLSNAVSAYRDAAAETRRLPIMQATLEEFARLMDRKAANLEAKIAEAAPVEGDA